MKTELKTEDYVYLSGHGDNISLHRIEDSFSSTQRLEHIGFALDSVSSVNALYEKMKSKKITILDPPKTFGIGTHLFSVCDPDGIEKVRGLTISTPYLVHSKHLTSTKNAGFRSNLYERILIIQD